MTTQAHFALDGPVVYGLVHDEKEFEPVHSKTLRRTCLAAAGLAAATLLQGCGDDFAQSQIAVSASDPCGEYRPAIQQARQQEIEAQREGAGIGAIFGAMMGGLMAGDDNVGESMLAGALVGGIAGHSLTYYQQKAEHAKDSQALLASVNADAGSEVALVSRTGQAAANLRSCRSGQLADLTMQVESGEIDTPTARQQLEEIQGLVMGDNEIISAAFNGIGQRVQAYVDATQQVAAADQSIAAAEVTKATPSVAVVQKEQVTQFNADVQAKDRLNEQIEALDILLG